MSKDNLTIDVFSKLGFDLDNLDADGQQADVIRNNPYFNKAIAEYKYQLMMTEDNITADPKYTFEEKSQYREHFSMLRLLLDGLMLTLDAKIMVLENQATNEQQH